MSELPETIRALKTIASFSLDGEQVDGEKYHMSCEDAMWTAGFAVTVAREVLGEIRELL